VVSLTADAVFPALTTTFPVYARSVGTGGPEIAGVLLASFALGSLVGVVGVIRLAERLNTFQMTAIGGVLVALPLWGIALSPPWWCCAAMLMISGAFIAMMSSPLFALILVNPPRSQSPPHSALSGQPLSVMRTHGSPSEPVMICVAHHRRRERGRCRQTRCRGGPSRRAAADARPMGKRHETG
jgi:Transmembrane secretion effector